MTRVAYFGTWELGYPRNEQVIAALRSVGVQVDLVHQDIWTDRHKFAPRPTVLPRLLASEARLGMRRVPRAVDALIVGYPGHFDIWSAKRHGKPVIFNALVSLYDTFVEDRRRFGPHSLAARGLRAVDRAAFRGADVVVSDTEANARYIAELAGIDRPAVCYVGAEERLFQKRWQPPEQFRVLFVGKLIPLHGLEVILEAARLLPAIPFRIIGSGQLEGLLQDLPGNVEHIAWVEYEQLPGEYANAGCALGVFGSSPKARRVIPNKAFQALAVGTPLVTASTEGVMEMLRDDRDALLVESTPEALVEAIRRLHDDRELAERIGAEGRRTFEREASETVLGHKWRAVIDTAVRLRGSVV
jgi:glycosyltransferase involved in cell wall biosynthesis